MMMKRKFLDCAAALAALLVAAACGGGGAETPAPTANPIGTGGAPAASGLSLQTQEDAPLTGQLPLPAGLTASAVTYELTRYATSGSLELFTDGRYRYQPYPDFSGIDGFAYRMVDARGVLGTFTVEVKVLPVDDDPPRLAGLSLAATLGEGVAQIPIGAADAGIGGALAVQRDGRILLTALGDSYPVVEQLAADGTPGGTLRLGLHNVFDVAVTADGKLVVAGSRSWDFAVARLNADGTPDGSFGGPDGIAVALPSTSVPTEATQVMPLADGSVLAGGYRYVYSGSTFDGVRSELVRFTREGRWDMAFGGGRGSVVFNGSAAAQPDGRILVATPAAGTSPAQLSRYLADGITLDASFGNGTAGAASDGRATVQSDGCILLVGIGAAGELKLQRFGADGAPDSQFGAGTGLVTVAASAHGTYAPRVVVQADGRILVGIVIRSGGAWGTAQALRRFHADGSIDESFGNGSGIALLPFGTADEGWSVVTPSFDMQPDGKIVVAGGGTSMHALLVRLLPDGTPDLDFGTRKPLHEGSAFVRTVPADTFTDPDGDPLAYSATLQDGSALPSWLRFDAATRTFSGTPPVGAANLYIKVTAIDPTGRSASSVFGVRVLAR